VAPAGAWRAYTRTVVTVESSPATAVSRGLTKDQREVLADWLIVIGAVLLFISLFLTWSHQFSPAFLLEFGTSDLLRGVPHDPTAWQVYSAADVLLLLLSVALVAVATVGTRSTRIAAAGAGAVALGFVFHALSSPPTNGANIFHAAYSVPHYASPGATAGAGETVAIFGLVLALAGLVVSFTAD
jgi:hypothetical protein